MIKRAGLYLLEGIVEKETLEQLARLFHVFVSSFPRNIHNPVYFHSWIVKKSRACARARSATFKNKIAILKPHGAF